MNLEPHLQRVIDEETDLSNKIKKLEEFLLTDTWRSLPIEEQCRLNVQLIFMRGYSDCLCQRIAVWDK